MNNLSFHLSKWDHIKYAKDDSIIVLEPSNNGGIPLNGISDFKGILEKIFDGIEINGKPANFSETEDGGYVAEFDNTKPIPEDIFTDETLEIICRLLSEAAKKDSYGNNPNERAINLAGEINVLLKEPAILRNFAALVNKYTTHKMLRGMAFFAEQIVAAIDKAEGDVELESAIAAEISQIEANRLSADLIDRAVEEVKPVPFGLVFSGIENAAKKCILCIQPLKGATKKKDFKHIFNIADILFKKVYNFERIYWDSDGVTLKERDNNVVDEGIGYRPGGIGNSITIPEYILTPKTLKKLVDFFKEAKTYEKQLKIAKAFNALFKYEATQEIFAALVGENITADTLISMANCAEEIAAAIGKINDKNAKSTIAAVISRMDTREITKESIGALATILREEEEVAISDFVGVIVYLFPEGKVTANRLKIMADHAEQIYDSISRVEWKAEPAIGAVISRIEDDQIAEGAIEVLIEILNKSGDEYGLVHFETIGELFSGDDSITVEILKRILSECEDKKVDFGSEYDRTNSSSVQETFSIINYNQEPVCSLNTRPVMLTPKIIETLPKVVRPIFYNNTQYPKQFMKVAKTILEHKKDVEEVGRFEDFEPEKAVFVSEFYEAIIKGKDNDEEFIEGVQDVCENMYEGNGITISSENKNKQKFKEAQWECARREIELRPDRTYSESVFVFNDTSVKINEECDPVTKDFVLTGNTALFGGKGIITFKGLPVDFPLNIIVDDVRERGFEEVMKGIVLKVDPYNTLKDSTLKINDDNEELIKYTIIVPTVSFPNKLSGFFKASREASAQGIIEKGSFHLL